MITGNNSVVLCQAEMQKAVQFYLDNIVFKTPGFAKVNLVKIEDNQCKSFHISLKDKETSK